MARVSISKEQWVVARAQWEGEPLVSYADIAEQLGTSRQAVKQHAGRNGWTKRLDLQSIADMAHAAADSKFTHSPQPSTPEEGAVYIGSSEKREGQRFPGSLPVIAPGASPEEAHQVATKAAVDARSDLLDRHRKEWMNVRTLAYGAIKSKQWEDARTAKTSAEAIKVIQDGERRAWGLDGDEKPGKPSSVQIVVNRKAGVKIGR